MEGKGQGKTGSGATLDIKVLAVQFDGHRGEVERTFQKVLGLVKPHVGKEIDVVVLPECALVGYTFAGKANVLPLAEVCCKGQQFEKAKELALLLKAYVVMGYIEKGAEGSPEDGR